MYLLILLSCFILILCFVLYYAKFKETPVVVKEIWWGPESGREINDVSIRPFRIDFSQEMIEDLRRRLSSYRPSKPSLPKVGFEYGFNTKEMPSWVEYWAHSYPFTYREVFLNQFPQFKTNIQGLDIHFIRVIPKVQQGIEVVPLLILHGWPGSVREFYETIPFLTAAEPGRDFALEVVAPSLPGCGFSDAADRPGLNVENMAVVLRNLMHRLGHRKFYVQGGDWGGMIGSDMATMFPGEVLGFHTNYALAVTAKGLLLHAFGALYPPLVVESTLANRMYPLITHLLVLVREIGYLHLQATKPDTLGIGLSDSPAGLLAYILQIFSTMSRMYNVSSEDGGLNLYSREALIDNLMMYWSSNSISTSFGIYTESLNKQLSLETVSRKRTKVPTWVLQARWEIVNQSPAILRTKYSNLIHATVSDDGGHFLALEKPEFFARDVLNAVQCFRKWHRENKI